MLIEPRVLKGFRDSLPEAETLRTAIRNTLEASFSRFGFVPIDTPVLEYTEVLLGKGGGETDKQVYRFDDHGGRDVAMRYDLTVPFARFVAAHINELYVPFRRYHIGKVFRGENTQRGRYREFVQCDFDIVGTDTASADFDVLLMIRESFRALGVQNAKIHISHRGIFNRFLEFHGVAGKSEAVLRIVDKLRKIGREKTKAALNQALPERTTEATLEFISAAGSFDQVLSTLTELSGGESDETRRMREIGTLAQAAGILDEITFDPSITRGLDYYTGVVFETFLGGIEKIGSVCSGGRYNNLVALYSKESIPGVGASIGLDRLLAALEELKVLPPSRASSDVLITLQDELLLGHYHFLAMQLRNQGIRAEVFPEKRKLGQQFAFAERKGIPLALICGQSEAERDVVNLRLLNDRANLEGLSVDEAIREIRSRSELDGADMAAGRQSVP